MQNILDEMLANKRIKLNKRQVLMHYFFVPIILFLGLLIYLLSAHSDAIWILVGSIVLATLYAYRQFMSLDFVLVDTAMDETTFKYEVAKLAKEMNWILEVSSTDWVIYSTAFKWSNWGSLIYMVRCDDQLMVKSICELYQRPSTLSFGKNQQFVNAFVERFSK
jgi:hypothetical protein